MENKDKPASPQSLTINAPEGHYIEVNAELGLTKREYAAIMAMQGMLANPANNSPRTYGVNGTDEIGFIALGEITTAAIVQADELFKQLEK